MTYLGSVPLAHPLSDTSRVLGVLGGRSRYEWWVSALLRRAEGYRAVQQARVHDAARSLGLPGG